LRPTLRACTEGRELAAAGVSRFVGERVRGDLGRIDLDHVAEQVIDHLVDVVGRVEEPVAADLCDVLSLYDVERASQW
jgi:hypothetical protein